MLEYFSSLSLSLAVNTAAICWALTRVRSREIASPNTSRLDDRTPQQDDPGCAEVYRGCQPAKLGKAQCPAMPGKIHGISFVIVAGVSSAVSPLPWLSYSKVSGDNGRHRRLAKQFVCSPASHPSRSKYRASYRSCGRGCTPSRGWQRAALRPYRWASRDGRWGGTSSYRPGHPGWSLVAEQFSRRVRPCYSHPGLLHGCAAYRFAEHIVAKGTQVAEIGKRFQVNDGRVDIPFAFGSYRILWETFRCGYPECASSIALAGSKGKIRNLECQAGVRRTEVHLQRPAIPQRVTLSDEPSFPLCRSWALADNRLAILICTSLQIKSNSRCAAASTSALISNNTTR